MIRVRGKNMNQTETSLEKRVLALEARVIALENVAAALPQKSKAAKSTEARSHLSYGLDVLSLIEDHVEVLKLIHTIVPPADRGKNKIVLAYIRRAESKLGQFQSRFAQQDETPKRVEKGAAPYTVPPAPKPGVLSLLKPSALNRLFRSAARWNM